MAGPTFSADFDPSILEKAGLLKEAAEAADAAIKRLEKDALKAEKAGQRLNDQQVEQLKKYDALSKRAKDTIAKQQAAKDAAVAKEKAEDEAVKKWFADHHSDFKKRQEASRKAAAEQRRKSAADMHATRKDATLTKDALLGVKGLIGADSLRKFIRDGSLDFADLTRIAFASDRAITKLGEKVFGEGKALGFLKQSLKVAPFVGEAVSAISEGLGQHEKEKVVTNALAKEFGRSEIGEREFFFLQQRNRGVVDAFGQLRRGNISGALNTLGNFAGMSESPAEITGRFGKAAQGLMSMPKKERAKLLGEAIDQENKRVTGKIIRWGSEKTIPYNIRAEFEDELERKIKAREAELGLKLTPKQQAEMARETLFRFINSKLLPESVAENLAKLVEKALAEKREKYEPDKTAARVVQEGIEAQRENWFAQKHRSYNAEMRGLPDLDVPLQATAAEREDPLGSNPIAIRQGKARSQGVEFFTRVPAHTTD